MKEMERFVIGSRGIEAGRKEDNYQVECGNFHLVVDKITELGLRGLSYNVRLVFCFTRIKRRKLSYSVSALRIASRSLSSPL